MGLIDHLPAIGGIQTEGCAPMAHAWRADHDEVEPVVSPAHPYRHPLHRRSWAHLHVAVRKRMHKPPLARFTAAFLKASAMRKLPRHACPGEDGRSFCRAGGGRGLRRGDQAGRAWGDQAEQVLSSTAAVTPCRSSALSWAKAGPRCGAFQPGRRRGTPEQEGLLAALSKVTIDRFPNVLIVDDTEDARRLIRRILQAQGNYTISEAAERQPGHRAGPAAIRPTW